MSPKPKMAQDKYRIVRGRVVLRHKNGSQDILGVGDTYRPTVQEAINFLAQGRIAPIVSAAEVVAVEDNEVEDEDPQKNRPETTDDESEDEEEETLTKADFTSAASFKMWKGAGRPPMDGVTRSGSNDQFNVADVNEAIKQAEG